MYAIQQRIICAVVACACLLGVPAPALHAQSRGKPAAPSPKAPEPSTAPKADGIPVNAKSAVLMEGASGQILSSYNKDEKIPPASFVKVLTLYVVYTLLRDGKLKLTDEIPISKKAWETGGSKMYVELGSKIPLEEIVKGIAVVSGNDACIAVAEYAAGSADTFVKWMNEAAQKLGMTNSHFENPHGLPSPQQYTTANDMAVLTQRYITEFPDALKIHSILEYTYAGIRQDNRNTLLRKDASIDGLKTGYIAEAGYHLIATAKREERRLIAVVMGAKNRAIRAEEALKLLNYGYHSFAFVSLFAPGQVLYELPVWKGQSNIVRVVPGVEGMIVLPADQKNKLTYEKTVPEFMEAPIAKRQEIGTYVVKVGSTVLRSIPLVAETEVPKAGFVKVLWNTLIYFFGRVKIVTYILAAVVLLVLVVLSLKMFSRARRPRSSLRY
jgi:D-alanyl-D-alanine carboxypeptidase (penicillin-binding protein 5/6)